MQRAIEERVILVFKLSDEELGVNISCVRRVLRPVAIHPLPNAPDFIEGVMDAEKHIITVIDLRKKFNLKAVNSGPATRVIVCKVNTFIVGLIVDSVSEVIHVPVKDIQPTPTIISTHMKDGCLEGIARAGERVITLIDLEKMLTGEEITGLSRVKR